MTLEINAERLMESLFAMAAIGGTEKGGCNRQALTDLDIQGRILLGEWCAALGLGLSFDAVGNMFARLDGLDPTLPPLVIGSHLDTQPTGGKYDGVLGVLAGLEVLRVLHEKGIQPSRSIEVAIWMNEEGSRFAPAMMGSGVFSEMLNLDDVRAVADKDGITVGAELDRFQYALCPHPTAKTIHAYLELHIEQGPVLEAEDKPIGVVTGAQGIRWYDVTITGQEAHAGPTPMSLRRDPMEVVPDLVRGVLKIGKIDEDARATIGQLHANPSSRNVIPASIDLTVDLRHPDEQVLEKMHKQLHTLINRVKKKVARVEVEIDQIWHSPVVSFDDALIAAIRAGTEAHGLNHCDIVSGAGHDALMVARKVSTGMIFIPCKDGISHNEIEHAEPAHIAAGANVLLSATLDLLDL